MDIDKAWIRVTCACFVWPGCNNSHVVITTRSEMAHANATGDIPIGVAEALRLSGWRLDFGKWICPNHD